MHRSTHLVVALAALLATLGCAEARAEKKTVCTITVNSSDEKETFRRYLPADKFRFVELVEHGRPDWLASACAQRTRCDVLVISGHYDGRDEFYSDQPGAREFLPVEEMERASCSKSCSELFSRLKEVYLFGCNTLNPEALKHFSSEIARSLVRSGHSPTEAEKLSRGIASLHGASSRDRMRLVFDGVPAIYGFSAKAPVGPVAASMLGGYFRSGGGAEVSSGRASSRLLAHFPKSSLAVASGIGAADPLASVRNDVCRFSDDALSAAQKLAFVHQLLGRDMAEVRPYFDRIEKVVGSLSEADRANPAVAAALDEIARDESARARYLAFARDADQPTIRARMVKLALRLDWLTPAEERDELAALLRDRLYARLTPADVELACSLNDHHELDSELPALASTNPEPTLGQAAVLACLGSSEARGRVVPALLSARGEDAEMAEVYLKHRPLTDAGELRTVTAEIANADDPKVQARALDALAGQHMADRESLEALARLFPVAKDAEVQIAIAGVLLRSDYEAIASPEVAQSLRETRLRTRGGPNLVDALIRRLETQ